MRSAKVVPRGCSRPLQRVIVDFAADQSFALARMNLLEHYGFEIGESTIQRVALGHAKTVFEAGGASHDFPQTVGRHKEIVAQTDGGMIPIVDRPLACLVRSPSVRFCGGGVRCKSPRMTNTISTDHLAAAREWFRCGIRKCTRSIRNRARPVVYRWQQDHRGGPGASGYAFGHTAVPQLAE